MAKIQVSPHTKEQRCTYLAVLAARKLDDVLWVWATRHTGSSVALVAAMMASLHLFLLCTGFGYLAFTGRGEELHEWIQQVVDNDQNID